MRNADVVDLTANEMLVADGAGAYSCALLGGFTAAAIIFEQWWAVASSLISAYNSGCFS